MPIDLVNCPNCGSINTDWKFTPLEYNGFLCRTKAYQKNIPIIK